LNLVDNPKRPHMFIKELELNLSFYQKTIKEYLAKPSDLVKKQIQNMGKNIENGIQYYRELFAEQSDLILKQLDDKWAEFITIKPM